MSITKIIQSSGVKVKIDTKKLPQSEKPKRNRLESCLDYLDEQIAMLEKQGNLDPTYHTIKEGKRKGQKVRAINAWSAVDDEGKREILIMCKNKKLYINETAATENKGIFMDDADNNYKGVLAFLKHLRAEFGKLDKEDFNPYTRIKSTNKVKKIA